MMAAIATLHVVMRIIVPSLKCDITHGASVGSAHSDFRCRYRSSLCSQPLGSRDYFTGVSVNALRANPYCGGLSREKRRIFSPLESVIVTGSDSCHFPEVKGMLITVLEESPTEIFSRCS